METRMSVGTLAGTVAADDATIETRVASLDWPHIASDLDARGSAVIAGLLASHECAALAALYDEDGRFRSRVVMRSAEHTSELQSLMRISYAVFCLKKKSIDH